MNSESERRLSTDELKARNRADAEKPKNLLSSAPPSTPTQPMHPIVIQCLLPQAMNKLTAALKSIDSLLESGALARTDGRKTVVMVGEVKNSTSTPVNTRILTDKIRQAILKSGKAVTTTAVGAKGAEETATRQVRELENDDLFNQATEQKRGTVISPDMSLSGEIVQQKSKVGRDGEYTQGCYPRYIPSHCGSRSKNRLRSSRAYRPMHYKCK